MAVCHVLRYAPYFMAMREVIKKGMIGDIVSVQHLEPIQYSHMAHSYVRGNWRSSKQTTPIILAKSCHDLDIIRYLVGKPCETIVADGSLYLFKKENAPEGAPLRCLDGCPHEKDCPYNAVDIYLKKRRHLQGLRTDFSRQMTDDEIMTAIKTGPYGRCVYHCDNDVVDHQIVNMELEDETTISFVVNAFTCNDFRGTHIKMTKGEIDGNETTLRVRKFRGNEETVYDFSDLSNQPFHAGADLNIVEEFVNSITRSSEGVLSSTIESSIESHVVCYEAETSRLTNQTIMIE